MKHYAKFIRKQYYVIQEVGFHHINVYNRKYLISSLEELNKAMKVVYNLFKEKGYRDFFELVDGENGSCEIKRQRNYFQIDVVEINDGYNTTYVGSKLLQEAAEIEVKMNTKILNSEIYSFLLEKFKIRRTKL